MRYLATYGFIRPVPADRTKCAARVFPRAGGCHQCRYTPQHDPDDDGNPTTCGVHSAEAYERRKAKRQDAEQGSGFAAAVMLGRLYALCPPSDPPVESTLPQVDVIPPS